MRSWVRVVVAVLLAAAGAVVAAQVSAAPALAATATVSPAGIDWAPGTTGYQDILVPAAAWAAQDQFLVSVPDVGVKIDVRSQGNNGFDCAPTQATNAPTELRGVPRSRWRQPPSVGTGGGRCSA